jgi:hypothetical protein
LSRALLALALLAGAGCKKDAGAPAAPAAPRKAEVEMAGTWSRGAVAQGAVAFVAQKEPCLPVPASATVYGRTALENPGPFGVEYFIPQGSVGHACLYATQGGKVIGAASYEKNPLTFQGEGEVTFMGLKLELAAVP